MFQAFSITGLTSAILNLFLGDGKRKFDDLFKKTVCISVAFHYNNLFLSYKNI